MLEMWIPPITGLFILLSSTPASSCSALYLSVCLHSLPSVYVNGGAPYLWPVVTGRIGEQDGEREGGGGVEGQQKDLLAPILIDHN